jgi:peroxiredoxin
MHDTRLLGTALACLTLAAGLAPSRAQKVSDPGKGTLTRTPPKDTGEVKDRSHSAHGAAFDQGPRQRAHLLKGVGNVHFPITTAKPEAQRFFDQGVNLLYSFSWYEAERAFRQAAMLDPDCPMAYWGMAMADSSRAKEFLKPAQEKKGRATDRERRYIDALAINYREGGDEKSRTNDNIHALEQLVLAYPEDIEAKAMLAWALKGQQSGGVSYRVAIDSLLREVLAKNPLHPGAHHYRIHMWEGPEAGTALDSCRGFARAAPGVGHAQHMPGHIYARLGMWDQAVYAMDCATRDERRYFYEQGQMPFESWDYLHNQDFLIANIGYTGRISEGLRLAQELLDVPRDPQYNASGTANTGRFGMLRMRVRGERWDDILNEAQPGWSDSPDEKVWLLYARGLAYLGKGDREAARKQMAELDALKFGGDERECARLELRGRLAVADGNAKAGLEALKKAADTEKSRFPYGDPGPYPRPLYESLAWGYLEAGQPADAEATLRDGLQREPNNGFALCLLIETLVRANRSADAVKAYASLRTAWRHADPDLPMLRRVQALHLDTADRAKFPTPYVPTAEQERLGPNSWQPFPAPDFAATGPDGKTVRMADFRGHNLLLVFYLGGSCPACTRQLEALAKEKTAFDGLDIRIVAISTDTPAMNKSFLAMTPDFPLLLLSDPAGTAAQRYKARDEFENLDLHAVVLVDKNGRVWWERSGSEPFTDFKFLKGEIARMRAYLARSRSAGRTIASRSHP